MPKWLPASCKVCKAKRADGTPISRRGLCGPCGERNLAAAVADMHAKRGPRWDAYVARIMAASATTPGGGVGVGTGSAIEPANDTDRTT